jgi:hypothetical protein
MDRQHDYPELYAISRQSIILAPGSSYVLYSICKLSITSYGAATSFVADDLRRTP